MSENSGSDPRGLIVDALKLEYATLAARYDNIYKALWQNFSFISVVAAAVLTFGSAALQSWAALMFAGLPFLFWYFVTFVPLDRYGNDARARLGEIESALNAVVPGLNMRTFSNFNENALKERSERKYRVVEAMTVAFWLGLVLWLVAIVLAYTQQGLFVRPPK